MFNKINNFQYPTKNYGAKKNIMNEIASMNQVLLSCKTGFEELPYLSIRLTICHLSCILAFHSFFNIFKIQRKL